MDGVQGLSALYLALSPAPACIVPSPSGDREADRIVGLAGLQIRREDGRAESHRGGKEKIRGGDKLMHAIIDGI